MRPTRQSSRVARKNIARAIENDSDGDDSDRDPHATVEVKHSGDESEVSEIASPPTKRRKLGPSNVAGPSRPRQKGKLSALLAVMPTEVIGVVCSFLLPNELLQVAQSSKIFAAFLLSPGSSSIWKAARLRLGEGFPDRPSDLTEQKYACLVFGRYCQRCGKLGGRTSMGVWTLRRRWCEQCRTEILEGRDDKYRIRPPIQASTTPRTFTLVHAGYLQRKEKLYRQIVYEVYLRDEAAEVDAILKAADDDVEQIFGFQSQRRADIMDRMQHGKLLDAWFAEKSTVRDEELSRLRAERVNDLKSRLVQAGYQPQILDCISPKAYSGFPTMKTARRFTEKEWTSVGPSILSEVSIAVSQLKQTAERNARFHFIEVFYPAYIQRLLPTTDFIPEALDVRELSHVKYELETWASGAENLPKLLSTPIGLDIPLSVQEQVAIGIMQFQVDLRAQFSAKLPYSKRLGSKLNPSDLLNLAISMFMPSASAPRQTPNDDHITSEVNFGIPFHLLQRMHKYLPRGRDQEKDPAWVFDKVSSTIIKDIVGLCGFHPDSCTRSQLEKTGSFVVCLTCTSSRLPTMPWALAPRHWRAKHSNIHEAGSAWRILSPAERERFLPIWRKRGHSRRVECLMCHDIGPSLALYDLNEFGDHCVTQHPGTDPTQDRTHTLSSLDRNVEPLDWAPRG
ncbi:hypothetical protein DL93DRAFT_2080950 [Clavulina sp. PMI_390]|nr:hypothetical protein DL93DRAFT_2080950 [Clavulina sp. PMI_390]